MANLDVASERQLNTQAGGGGNSPLEGPQRSPTHSPRSSPHPRSADRIREISPSLLDNPDGDAQVRNIAK